MRYSDEEWSLICRAAAGVGMSPGAWAQQRACEIARRQRPRPAADAPALAALLVEVHRTRRVLGRMVGNLTQLDAVAAAAGRAADQGSIREVRATVRAVLGRYDATGDELESPG
jgi:acetate kinase